ncbi:MAG: hypothetical protein BAJALOKI1v1_620003 [Promethearchaeota archaeon]|nr:MAG: hypothetical protein BAJALOKI1v1_620003 [Candidatus Lokiarchaeota archaeon]
MNPHYKRKGRYYKISYSKCIVIIFSLLIILFAGFWIDNIPNNKSKINEQLTLHSLNNNPLLNPIQPSIQATNVCITEVSYKGSPDWVEIYNPTNNQVNLSGWRLEDGGDGGLGYDLPNINLSAGEVVTFGHASADEILNYTHSDFWNALTNDDEVILRDDGGNIHDVVIWGSGSNIDLTYPAWFWNSSDTADAPDLDGSIQRINKTLGGELEDSNTPKDWVFINTPTNGTLLQYNPISPEIGSIIISEVMYGGDDNEWIELYNNESEDVNIGNCSIYSYQNDLEIKIPLNDIISSHDTYIIGEIPSADYQISLSLNNNGNVLELKNATGKILDIVIWGSGSPNFTAGAGTGWDDTLNATGNLPENQSIFRYHLTQNVLSDTNSSADWYNTSQPTVNGFYELSAGDVIFSEIAMDTGTSGDPEFIELYNTLFWPVTLDGMEIWDYGYNEGSGTDEVIFKGSLIIPARDVFTVGDSGGGFNYTDPDDIELTNGYEDLVLYRDSTRSYELDVIIYGDDFSNEYPWGPGSGWIGPNNATDPANDLSLHRIMTFDGELQDTDTSADWIEDTISNGTLPSYLSGNIPGYFITNEDAADPDNDGLFNVTWNSSTGATNYLLYSSDEQITELNGTQTLLADLRASDSAYQISASNGIHFYTIAAYNASGYNLSNSVSVNIQKPPGSFALSTDADTPIDTDGIFNLIWDTSDEANNYSIYMHNEPITQINDSVTLIAEYVAISPFSISNYSGTYYYIVVAFNNFGNTTSNCINVTIIRPKNIIITEVMYGGNNNEWIEIFNTGPLATNIGNFSLYSYFNDYKILIPENIILNPYETYVIGEDLAAVNDSESLELNDVGDVLILNDTLVNNLDVLVWGSGSSSFLPGVGSGWEGNSNVTGGLTEGKSIFRYNLSRTVLSDTNKSEDWYETVNSNPTPNSFYKIKSGDILFSEIGMSEPQYDEEFIELYNNLTWPITLDEMVIWDYGAGTDEVTFSGNILIPAKSTFTVGDAPGPGGNPYNYTVEISLSNDYEDLVLYYNIARTIELDVIIYGNDISNTYPTGAGTGWVGSEGATGGLSSGTSLQRINGSDFLLIDTNSSSDWQSGIISPNSIPDYTPPAVASSVLITEVMINPEGSEHEYEYIEIYNTLDEEIDIGAWSLWDSDDWEEGEAEITLPAGIVLPSHSYFLFADNATAIQNAYGFEGLNYTQNMLWLTNGDPNDIILADTYKNIIDRVAYRTSSSEYFWDPLFPDPSWKNYDRGVYSGHEDNTLARLYDPYNGNRYIDDTNSSKDWRYDVPPTPGNHTNNAYFLSTPFVENASIITFTSPDNSYAAITHLFRAAESTIDLCIYQFTSWWLLQELNNSMNRGVQVRLLLENYFPGASVSSGGTDEAYEQVYVAEQVDAHENGTARWENKGWRFTHSKYFIIDGETVVISTENFKFTGIPKDPSAGNRGWGIAVNNTNIAQQYEKVFNLDWSESVALNDISLVDGEEHENKEILEGSYDSPVGAETFQNYTIKNAQIQTLVGPDETIDVLVELINSATESICCEVFYLYPTWDDYYGGKNNNPFLRALIDASYRGVNVQVILDSTDYNLLGDNNNDEAFAILKAAGINVVYSNNVDGIEKFHVKALVVDREAVMISSLNWNENSATNNREIGIIVNSTDVAGYYLTIFNYDWQEYSSGGLIGFEQFINEFLELGFIASFLEVPQSHFWVFWLPIASALYFGILIAGYVVRNQKEKRKRRDELKRIKQLEKTQKPKEEIPIQKIPLKIEPIRTRINEFYGDEVNIYHLTPKGEAYDKFKPSGFIKQYIRVNNDLIRVGELLRPLSRILVLKYALEDYLIVEGKLELQFNLFDESLKSKIQQLEEKIKKMNDEEKTPLDDLIAELQSKINQQKSYISKLEEKE